MIKKRDKKIISILEKVAVDVVPVSSARIASAIVHDGDIISIGINQEKTHTLAAKYARKEDCGNMLHSEIHAIAQATRRMSPSDLADSTLYICRVKYTGPIEVGGVFQLGLAKPCCGCMDAISDFKIRRVVYTTDQETLEEINGL